MPSSPAPRLVRVRTRLSLRPVLAAVTGLLLVMGGATLAQAEEPGTGTGGGSSPTPTSLSSSIPTTTSIQCQPVTYTGAPLTPCTATTTASDGTVVGHPAVTYVNNVNATDPNGDPRRWATASASYSDPTGSYGESRAEKNFPIRPRAISVSIGCPTVVAYTGSAVEPCSATVDGQDASGSINYRDNVGPGTATATLVITGDPNTTGGGGSARFTIGYPTTVTLTCSGATYTGSTLTPCTARATSAYDPKFSADVTSNIVYVGNTDAGTATAYVSYAGDGAGGHLASSSTATFVIAKAPSVTAISCPVSVVYTGEYQTPCTATVTGAGGLQAAASTKYSWNRDAGSASLYAWYSGDANHEASNAYGGFVIAKAPVSIAVTCPTSVDYTGAALTPCAATSSTTAGTLTGTTTVTYADNVYTGTATATGTYSGDANHLAGTGTATFQVKGFTLTGYDGPLVTGTGGAIVWNTVKAGSTIPLRFSAALPDGTPVPTTTALGATFSVTPVSCTTGAPTGPTTATGGGIATSYLGVAGQFGLNWKSPKAPGCYRLTTTTADHSTLSAYVVLR